MAELVDAHDSKSCVVIHESSILSPGTNKITLSGVFLFVPGSKPTAWLMQENRKTFPYELLRGGKVPANVVGDSLSCSNFRAGPEV